MFHVKPKRDWDVYHVLGGVIIFHPFRDGVKMHPNFLPESRGAKAFAEIRKHMRRYPLIYVEIDIELRHVNWAARHMGFELIESGERNLYRWRSK